MKAEVKAEERRVLMVVPTLRDGEITKGILAAAELECVVCPNLQRLAEEIAVGAGAILMTEAVIGNPGIDAVVKSLEQQPPWSDIAVVMLMSGGMESPVASPLVRALRNVTLLERPAPIQSLRSAVQAAVRGRERQYELREQMEAMREVEQRFYAMANWIPQLAWMARGDGDVFWYNQRWHDYCGTKPGDVEGWNWAKVHDPVELPRVIETWKKALAEGVPWEDTFPLRRHDGVFRWHLSRAMPLRDASGAVVLWFGTNTDITEERRAAEERQVLLESERAARREAERLGRLKDEFLATLSHELRTPLNAIFGWTQLLMRSRNDPEATEEGLEAIDRNVRMLTELISDLLDISRITAGKVRLNMQQVDLAMVIREAIEGIKPAAGAKEIKVEKIIATDAGMVSGDPARLQQVLWNLLTNAVKFTPKGGTIQVRLERAASQVRVSVTDTGEGIREDFLSHLFERFSQADGSKSRKHGGLGLGLSIVKSIVEMHGGSVGAASRGVELGATFTFCLPIRPAKVTGPVEAVQKSEGAPEGVAHRDALPLKGLKILLVDDEPDAREYLKRLLMECEAVPLVAGSAEEATALLETHTPDLILSDIGMPGQDGYAFIREVRKKGIKTPAVALTAYGRAEDRVWSMEAGYQMHLTKPVESTELVAVVARLAESLV